ncbi:hypothetical protein LQZ18_14045 [Lachnospiraceae bacterium ZAX-1]
MNKIQIGYNKKLEVKIMKRYFIIVLIPLIISLFIDWSVGLKGHTSTYIFIVLFGIISYFYKDKDADREKQIKRHKKKIVAMLIVSACAIVLLIFVNNSIVLIKDADVKMIVQSVLALLVSAGVLISLNLLTLKISKKIK